MVLFTSQLASIQVKFFLMLDYIVLNKRQDYIQFSSFY